MDFRSPHPNGASHHQARQTEHPRLRGTMSATQNEARGLLGNQYFTWHALPRSAVRKLRSRSGHALSTSCPPREQCLVHALIHTSVFGQAEPSSTYSTRIRTRRIHAADLGSSTRTDVRQPASFLITVKCRQNNVRLVVDASATRRLQLGNALRPYPSR